MLRKKFNCPMVPIENLSQIYNKLERKTFLFTTVSGALMTSGIALLKKSDYSNNTSNIIQLGLIAVSYAVAYPAGLIAGCGFTNIAGINNLYADNPQTQKSMLLAHLRAMGQQIIPFTAAACFGMTAALTTNKHLNNHLDEKAAPSINQQAINETMPELTQ